MHVVFLVHDFPTKGISTSGAANYVANMAKLLVGNGNQVTVIVEDKEAKVLEWNGIDVRHIRATRGFKDTGRPMPVYKKILKNLARSIWYNYEVFRVNKHRKIDIVQSVNSYGIAMLRLKNIPYVVRISDYASLWSGANKWNYSFEECLATRRKDEELQLVAIKRADAVIVPSKLLQKVYSDRVENNYYLVESPVVIDRKADSTLYEENITPEKYFLTYGDNIYRKSIHIVARIIDDLLDKYPDMKYVIIGRDKDVYYQGEYIKASQMFYTNVERNRDRFIFMGEVTDRKRLFSIIKNAKLCILPTRVDNLPNTCLESLALGKIIISSYGTSVEQLITDGYNGFLAEVDDAESIQEKVDIAMRLSEAEQQLFENRAMARVKDLTPDKVYQVMFGIYKETIENFNSR